MTPDNIARYSAFASRDPRFDGVFFVGVTSTGIYCRPVCTARTPKAANCRFFDSAEAAERASFRPCLRCRPELAPGNAPVDDAHRIAHLVAQRIDEGMLDDGAGLERIAARFGWSSRQIRRLVHHELGVSPMELVLTRRLLLAKQLLTDTTLSVTDVAFASGFSSVRRFNDAFVRRYAMPPSRLRHAASGTTRGVATRVAHDSVMLRLTYRAPFDWEELLGFLRPRALRGVEWIDETAYHRAVQLGAHSGWVCVTHAPEKRALVVEFARALTPALPPLLGRLRHLFDLDARPDVIAGQLGEDAVLAGAVARHPGLRIPGAFDGFDMAVRAIVGQQITVRAATTIAGRLAHAFGEAITTPFAALTHRSPGAERLARASVDEIARLGVIQTRARSIIALARAVAEGRLSLEPGADAETTIRQLVDLPGIGAWTAHYVAMRALCWPDAFPKEDVVLRKRLGGVSAARAEKLSQRWRPWRSYAALHLWNSPARADVS